MIQQLLYPNAGELRVIEQTMVQALTMDDPVFGIFPLRNTDADFLMWVQKGNYLGLQQVRGLNGEPPRVSRVGVNQFAQRPGYYGEHGELDEEALTTMRQYDSWNAPVDASTLVREQQDQLTIRRVMRMRWICWTLLISGVFAVFDVKGVLTHSDNFTPRVYTATVPWSTSATATPLANFTAVQRMARGYSLAFGVTATAFMNAQTWEYLRSNSNSADVYGRRTQGLGTYNSLAQVNELFMGDGLPRVVIFDEGYLDDNGVFQLFIPDNRVVVVGKRTTGTAVGEYRMTRNVNNPGFAPGVYARVIDLGEIRIPRTLEVHNGHNGGPVTYHPEAIVVMYV